MTKKTQIRPGGEAMRGSNRGAWRGSTNEGRSVADSEKISKQDGHLDGLATNGVSETNGEQHIFTRKRKARFESHTNISEDAHP